MPLSGRMSATCRPDNGFDTTLVCITPYQRHRTGSNSPERYAHMPEYIRVENKTNKIEFGSRTEHSRKQKKESACTVSLHTDPSAEITVNTCQIEPVVHRKQHVRHHQITEKESEDSLHICHIHTSHHPRHGNKRHSRYAGANHSEGNDVPRRPVLSPEECSIRTAFLSFSGEPGNQKQYCKIADNSDQFLITGAKVRFILKPASV